MEKQIVKRNISRKRRIFRIRKFLKGTAEKPRLNVFKSNRHIYAQLIDDEKGMTIGGIGTLSKTSEFKAKSKEAAKYLGTKIGEIAKKNNIKEVVFDRGRFKYHGIIAALADAARASGIQF